MQESCSVCWNIEALNSTIREVVFQFLAVLRLYIVLPESNSVYCNADVSCSANRQLVMILGVA